MSTETLTESNDAGDVEHTLPIGADGETLPAQEIVTGRGFITGKSGSGKSNSVTVLLEELFELGLPALVVDTDGEYWPLKERYELLHVGDTDRTDASISPDTADELADMALEKGVPIILDVSEYDDEYAEEIIEAVVRALFAKEAHARRPYLLVVEEIHEYLPQRGSSDLTDLLTKVAKRGRKRGLGLLGASQRPSAVDKDYITQANWVLWHRLTWENDTKNAGKVLGKGYEEPITSLDDGEGFLQADWTEQVSTIKLRRKHVHDAGATPDIDSYVGRGMSHDATELTDRLTPDGDFEGADADADADDSAAGGQCQELKKQVVRLQDKLEEREEQLTQARHRVGYLEERVDELTESSNPTVTAEDLGEHYAAAFDAVETNDPAAFDDVYADYCERVDDARAKRTVRAYLGELEENGLIRKSGSKKTRQYHVAGNDVDLPDGVSVNDVRVVVRDASHLGDVQRELGVSHDEARRILRETDLSNAVGDDDRDGRDDRRPERLARIDGRHRTVGVTVKTPADLVACIDAAVDMELYNSRSEVVRKAAAEFVVDRGIEASDGDCELEYNEP